MKRVNKFGLRPTKGQEMVLFSLCDETVRDDCNIEKEDVVVLDG